MERQMWLDYSRQVAADMTVRTERAGPYFAEIIPGVEPRWHVLIIAPNAYKTAIHHLTHRRFGIYHPTYERRIETHEGLRHRIIQPALLPGYLLIHVWDFSAHHRRIFECPGVLDVMRVDSNRPVAIGWEIIDRLQRAEFSQENMPSMYARMAAMEPKPEAKRRGRREKWAREEPQDRTIYTGRYGFGYDSVDSEERLAAFRNDVKRVA